MTFTGASFIPFPLPKGQTNSISTLLSFAIEILDTWNLNNECLQIYCRGLRLSEGEEVSCTKKSVNSNKKAWVIFLPLY